MRGVRGDVQGRGLRHMDTIAREFVTERGCELVALGMYRCPLARPNIGGLQPVGIKKRLKLPH